MIAEIQKYVTRTYSDTGQIVATAFWTDEAGKHGSTSGNPASSHMAELKRRAQREGSTVTTETW